jgi:hypothetical protein
MAILHSKVSTFVDGDNADLVLPSDWNASHIGTLESTRIDSGSSASGLALISDGSGSTLWGDAGSPDAVIGPASATDGHLVVFDSTSGKLVKDGGAVPSGGGGITQVNPSDVANKAVWFDAGTISGNHNDPVASWADQSGRGLDATQSNAALKPTLDKTTFSQPAVYFNGSKVMSLSRPLEGDWTIIAVVASINTDGADAYWYNQKGIFGVESAGVANDWALTWDGGTGGAGTGNPETTLRGTQFIADGAFHIITFSRKKTTPFINLFIDGIWCGYSRSSSAADLNVASTVFLGAFQAAAGYFTGWIAEIFASSTFLSKANREGVEAFYRNKFGIG